MRKVKIDGRNRHIAVGQSPAVGVGGFRLKFGTVAHQPEIGSAVRVLAFLQFVLPSAVRHAAHAHPFEAFAEWEVDVQTAERGQLVGERIFREFQKIVVQGREVGSQTMVTE